MSFLLRLYQVLAWSHPLTVHVHMCSRLYLDEGLVLPGLLATTRPLEGLAGVLAGVLAGDLASTTPEPGLATLLLPLWPPLLEGRSPNTPRR